MHPTFWVLHDAHLVIRHIADYVSTCRHGEPEFRAELSMANHAPRTAFIAEGAAWANSGFPREDPVHAETLHLSYIVRVEGCSGPASVQRLQLWTAGGATHAQGMGMCVATWAQEVSAAAMPFSHTLCAPGQQTALCKI